MRSRSILLYMLLAGALLAASCSDDTVQPQDRSFSLEITVVDERGDPVDGMDVQVHAPIKGIFKTEKRRAKTVLPFKVPIVCDVTVTVSHLDGRFIKRLSDAGGIPAGSYQIAWDGRDSQGEPVLGTVPLSFQFVAKSVENASILYEAEAIGVLYTSMDVALQPVVGQTGASGKVRVTDRSFFPTLQDLPTIDQVNYVGEVGDPIEFDESIEIVVRDPSSGDWVSDSILLRDGPNELRVRWVDPHPTEAPTTTVAAAPAIRKDIDVPIPDMQFSVGPVYPNPFN